MTERSRIRRARRWLAYKLLPDTTEYGVALTRQQALQDLRTAAERIDDRLISERFDHTADRLADRVPVRDEWDREDGDSQ